MSLRGVKTYFVSVLLLPWVLTSSVETALAHGNHGDAAPTKRGISLIILGEFQVELLTSPSPPRAGRENKIVAKILRSGSLEPVRNGKVSIAIVPVRVVDYSRSKSLVAKTNPGTDPLSLSPAPEMVWAGSYTLIRQLEQKGPYQVRVAISKLGEKSFKPPALLEFYLDVAPVSGFSSSLIFLLLTALGIGLVGAYWTIVRSRSPVDLSDPINLLGLRWLNRFVRWDGFQSTFQIPFLLLMILVTLLGLFGIQDGGKNLATKLTWILWWPGVIFTFILFGRLWCVMCPFGTLNEGASILGGPKRTFPKYLRNLWLATFFFVLLTWADEQLGVIRSPQMTAWLIIFFAVLSIGVGVFYQRRSFCRYLCPISGLIGLYSMVSPVELRSEDRSRCQKDCSQDCYRGNEAAMGCPMFEFPMTMDRNTYCNLCFECVKSCPPGNMTLRLRSFGKDLWISGRRYLDESYLAVALVGLTTIVTAQMLTDWSGWISGLARMIPVTIRTLMKPVTYLTLTESVIFILGSLLFFPFLAFLAAWAANRISGDEGRGTKMTFVTMGYMFIPVGLAMHLAHNVSHLFSEGPGVVPALQNALNQYTSFYAGDPNWQTAPLASSDVTYWLQMVILLSGFVFSIVVGQRRVMGFFNPKEFAGNAFIPFIVLSLFFTLTNLYLLNQPMGMRHGM